VIHFHCTCGKRLKVDDAYIGRLAECSRCHARIMVPAESEEAPPPATTGSLDALAQAMQTGPVGPPYSQASGKAPAAHSHAAASAAHSARPAGQAPAAQPGQPAVSFKDLAALEFFGQISAQPGDAQPARAAAPGTNLAMMHRRDTPADNKTMYLVMAAAFGVLVLTGLVLYLTGVVGQAPPPVEQTVARPAAKTPAAPASATATAPATKSALPESATAAAPAATGGLPASASAPAAAPVTPESVKAAAATPPAAPAAPSAAAK
jgi:hypothetical protein